MLNDVFNQGRIQAGAQQVRVPCKFWWTIFFNPVCTRMLQNKAQIAWESI